MKKLIKQIVIAKSCQATHDSEIKYLNEFSQKNNFYLNRP